MTSGDGRGQTTLDFAIGISVFLAVIVFVFAFVGGILTPFNSANERQTVEVGRIADSLSNDVLGSPTTPYVLDRQTTVTFLTSSNPLEADIDIAPGTNANVTLVGNTTEGTPQSESLQLCWDGALVEIDDTAGGCSNKLARGPTPPESNDATISAVRVVSLAGEGVELRVVMW